MPIHTIAIQVLDQIIAKATINQRANDHWWDDEVFVITPSSVQELKIKQSSIERRLKKVDQAFEALLTAEELGWHRFLKTEPKNMDDIHKRKQFLSKLYAVLDQDEQKLACYRQYQKLNNQYNRLVAKINYASDIDELADNVEHKATTSFQLTVDWPNEVESSQMASAVTNLIHAALWKAGYSFEEYGTTSPIAYFDKGKLALEIDDKEEHFRFNTQPLEEMDWGKIRRALMELKQEVESAQGWKKRPTSQGEVWKKSGALDDLQLRILADHTLVDDNDTSYWDTWRPRVLGKERNEPLAMDTSNVSQKAVVTTDAASHYLGNLLGIQGLDFTHPQAGQVKCV